jgi:NADH:ubiquinone oxidoreductase subunit 5 (subunit L)/multisubunit Na+/H+ antiporter MnhA subunit
MEQLLVLFILLPLAGFVLSLAFPRRMEKPIALVAIGTMGLQAVLLLAFTTWWLINGHAVLDIRQFVVYKTEGFEFFIDFYFDKITAVFALAGSLLAFVVAVFSRTYLHREEGYKRFFNTIQFFFLGYCLIIFSGNFETLFVGWEIIGLSSFLLIAFYRDRYLPARNGLKIISFYRLSDICLILVMWLSHHLWHGNVTFAEFNNTAAVSEHFHAHPTTYLLIVFLLLGSAFIKSAQFPFSSWLPRAMEGPTTSSAVFYGALAVHVGVFVVMRTLPFWENVFAVKIVLVAVGLVTALVSTSIARVQSTVKTQIAYASSAQIGIIFIEVALGFENLALIHFAGNAFFRTYQLLLSPSVLNYQVHKQFFTFAPSKPNSSGGFTAKLRTTFYVLSLKEWNLDRMLRTVFWAPMKWIGKQLSFTTHTASLLTVTLAVPGGLGIYFAGDSIAESVRMHLPIVFASCALLVLLAAFSARTDARRTWALIVLGQFLLSLAFFHSENARATDITLYTAGILASAIVGFLCLQAIHAIDRNIRLDAYHGYAYERPRTAFVFLLAALGILAFPVTTAFVGLDVLLTTIGTEQVPMIALVSLCVVLIELASLRIYVRVFMGNHKKLSHPVAYRSS